MTHFENRKNNMEFFLLYFNILSTKMLNSFDLNSFAKFADLSHNEIAEITQDLTESKATLENRDALRFLKNILN